MESLLLKNKKKLGTSRHHPWVYSGAVLNLNSKAKVGDIVAVKNAEGELIGYGHRTGGKSIVCRIFSFTRAEIVIDDQFWMDKFHRALNYRKILGLIGNSETDSYRLFYSEGDELPGLVCDIFGKSASIQLASEGMEKILHLVVQFLKAELKISSIFVKSSQGSKWMEEAPPHVSFFENGLKLLSLIESGQKTGYFLDQRDNRLLVSQFSKGRRVLDAFCYLGGFGLHALKGGARSVSFLDASKTALEAVERNVKENFKNAEYTLEAADTFEYLRKMESDYFDLIILDPPAFAKRADFVKQAARGYKDINMTALKKIKRKSLLFTFSCSQHISKELFRTLIYQAALDAGRSVRIIRELGQATDHCTNIYHPEGDYLKGLALYVD